MSRNDPVVRMRHMLDFARRAVAIAKDRRRADLDSDDTIVLALC